MNVKLCNFEVRAFDEAAPLEFTFQKARDVSRVRRFVASNDTIDRYGDVVVANGIDLTNFAKAPRVQAFHDYGMWPIGKAIAGGVVGNDLLLDLEFDPPHIDEEADKVLAKIDYGTISTGSIGFIPKKVLRPGDTMSDGEKSLFAKYPGVGRIYTETELLEYSIVPIPANPNAIAAAYKAMIEDGEKRFGPGSGDAPEELDADIGAEDIEKLAKMLERMEKML